MAIPAAALPSHIIIGTMPVGTGSILMDVRRMASLPVAPCATLMDPIRPVIQTMAGD